MFPRRHHRHIKWEKIARNSILRKVNQFIDSDRVLKTKGRLGDAEMLEYALQKIIIGPQHPLSSAIISDAQKKCKIQEWNGH